MSVPGRLAAFAALLVAVLAGTYALGAAVGPVGSSTDADPAHDERHGGDHGGSSAAGSGVGAYRLRLVDDVVPAGPATLSFTVVDDRERTVRRFVTVHEERLHLIVVRSDTAGYQHVHPTMAADGSWSAPVTLTPGAWRLYADVQPEGSPESVTLEAGATVPGEGRPLPVPAPGRVALVDGYTVTLVGDPVAGRAGELRFRVERDGRGVSDLQPYLGAAGHLVVLRAEDLRYLHVHPEDATGETAGETTGGTAGETAGGPEVAFVTTLPTASRYRMFLDFRHGDVVRTAEFTVDAAAAAGAATTSAGAATTSAGAATTSDPGGTTTTSPGTGEHDHDHH